MGCNKSAVESAFPHLFLVQHSQLVQVLPDDNAKLAWLLRTIETFVDDGEVLVFANQKAKVGELTRALVAGGVKAAALHGDMSQAMRMQVLSGYRGGQHHVLVATDVAARGLDIKTVKTVVNYDAAKDMDTHVHRVGRTGRAGDKEGMAVTLLTTTQGAAAGRLMVICLNRKVEQPYTTHASPSQRHWFKTLPLLGKRFPRHCMPWP